MLWQSMSFMREASDRHSNLVERSTTVPTMFYFLERLLVHSGVFLPLGASQQNASLYQSEVFFVPSLLAQADPTNMWTYMTSESWMTTLCHSWLFRDGAPPNLMEHLTVRILRDLYQFTRSFQSTPAREPMLRVQSVPIGKSDFAEYAEEYGAEAIGTVRIHHVVCFQSSLLVKVGTIFADDKTGVLRESVVEVFVALVDQTSAHAVSSDVMRPCMQRVVVSGKGQAGRHGHKLWKGGYKLLLDTVRECLENMPNVDSQAICPECLATASPRVASTWGWDVVLAAAESGNPHVICLRGHRVNSNLICGTIPDRKAAPFSDPQSTQRNTKSMNIKEALPSVVLVGVWDPVSKSVVSVGSGFIADKKLGLIVTAGHVLFNLERSSDAFGRPYFGRKGAQAVIGVIPDRGGKNAVFRYLAEIVAHDVQNVDACVLQIRSRLEKDVDEKEGVGALNQPAKAIAIDRMPFEELRSLKLTKHFDLAESVRLLGYSQEGEGVYEMGKHISPSIEFVEGVIRRHFKATMYEDDGDSDSSRANSDRSQQRPTNQGFSPREEIVMHCLVNSGHSGGPCVNADGKVVGILSRSDPVERDRCYLVPTAEIRHLMLKARTLCAPRPHRITTMQTV
jgi:S1-C subfamily serine protease